MLRLVAVGPTNQAVADALGLSAETVKRHVGNLLMATGLRNRIELAHDAREHALNP